MRKKTKKGFTLIELIVVILILGVLAAIVAPVTFSAINKAKEAADTANASAMTSAIRLYIAANPTSYSTATVKAAIAAAGIITSSTVDLPAIQASGYSFRYISATKTVVAVNDTTTGVEITETLTIDGAE